MLIHPDKRSQDKPRCTRCPTSQLNLRLTRQTGIRSRASGRVSRELDFLGYFFSPDGLQIALHTIERFAGIIYGVDCFLNYS
ncbi:MAG: hypothetical protein F6K31_00505 [Symploca sp. SIO2G7]|nr:hypothetical protein [Symploca sp. SIO2G7]